jgi:hypothetical protein
MNIYLENVLSQYHIYIYGIYIYIYLDTIYNFIPAKTAVKVFI